MIKDLDFYYGIMSNYKKFYSLTDQEAIKSIASEVTREVVRILQVSGNMRSETL